MIHVDKYKQRRANLLPELAIYNHWTGLTTPSYALACVGAWKPCSLLSSYMVLEQINSLDLLKVFVPSVMTFSSHIV